MTLLDQAGPLNLRAAHTPHQPLPHTLDDAKGAVPLMGCNGHINAELRRPPPSLASLAAEDLVDMSTDDVKILFAVHIWQ